MPATRKTDSRNVEQEIANEAAQALKEERPSEKAMRVSAEKRQQENVEQEVEIDLFTQIENAVDDFMIMDNRVRHLTENGFIVSEDKLYAKVFLIRNSIKELLFDLLLMEHQEVREILK